MHSSPTMVKNYTEQIHICPKDKKRFRGEVRLEFLRHHPEFTDMEITDGVLFKKLIDYYLEN